MILCESNLRSVELVLAGPVTSAQLPWVATSLCRDQATGRLLRAQTFLGTTAGTTAVAPVPAPESGVSCKLQELAVQNADTAAATLTVRLNDGGATTAYFVVTLQPGDHLHYVDGAPLKLFDKFGATKQGWGKVSPIPGPDGEYVLADLTLFGGQIVSIDSGVNNPNTFTVGPQTIRTGADANKGFVVRANSAGQSANLVEVQDGSSAPQVYVRNDFRLFGNGAVNPGILAPYAGAGTPSGWLPCDGASYPTASYPDLFGAIGYSYGGSGPNFNVPDLTGHTP